MRPEQYWYLATPYSSYPNGRDAAYVAACQEAALLMEAGINVFSPISHTHGIAVHGVIDGHSDNRIWDRVDLPFVVGARGIILCMMTGWENSGGMQRELAVFEKMSKPVIRMMPGLVPYIQLQKYWSQARYHYFRDSTDGSWGVAGLPIQIMATGMSQLHAAAFACLLNGDIEHAKELRDAAHTEPNQRKS